MPSTYQLTLNFDNNDYKEQCNKMHYLVDRQRQLCSLSKNMLSVVSEGALIHSLSPLFLIIPFAGAKMGIEECQLQFSGRHWNCSMLHERDLMPELARQRIRLHKKQRMAKLANRTTLDLGMQADSPIMQMGDVFGGALQTGKRRYSRYSRP